MHDVTSVDEVMREDHDLRRQCRIILLNAQLKGVSPCST